MVMPRCCCTGLHRKVPRLPPPGPRRLAALQFLQARLHGWEAVMMNWIEFKICDGVGELGEEQRAPD